MIDHGWIDRIRASFRQIGPNMDGVMQALYVRLFEGRPDFRALFAAVEMEQQRLHFAASLSLIVRNLPMFDALEESLCELGRQHAAAGVRAEHYAVLRDAMLAAFAQALGEDWRSELHDDWKLLLDRIANQMLIGAQAGSHSAKTTPVGPLSS